MKRNKIKVVDSLTFKGMDSLKSLKMQRNGITKLMDGAFFGLNSIEELWVQCYRHSFKMTLFSSAIVEQYIVKPFEMAIKVCVNAQR